MTIFDQTPSKQKSNTYIHVIAIIYIIFFFSWMVELDEPS